MHEPSKELIEQIAKEYWDLELGASEGKLENASTDDKEYFCGLAEDWSNLPTIRKALELYENQPKWQDKPDKEGWWWIKSSNKELGIWVVEILEKDGTLLIPKYISMIGGTKSYLYIPEPEPL